MISCFFITLLTLLTYGVYSPLGMMGIFLYLRVGVVPLSVIISGASIMIGAIIGFFIESYVNRSIGDLSRSLLELERGNFSSKDSSFMFKEFEDIQSAFYRLFQRLEEQALTIQKKTNERAAKDQELLEQAISQERSRLARELHDSVSQQLFAISMMSSAMNESTKEQTPLKQQLQMVEEMSIQAQGEMRALLLHLRPVQLEGKKLTDGVNELLTELSAKQHLELTWHIDDLELEKGVEDHLFRILQEAISNSLRHAKATHLEVRLRKFETFAIMRVIDNGIGFDTKIRKAGSYGLESMQERVSEIGGVLKIMSVPNKGTQLEVKVLLQKSEEGLNDSSLTGG